MIDYFDLLISQEAKKFKSSIEPTFEPLFTVNKHNGCFQLKVNETHATLPGDLNLEFFNALSNALNLVLAAKQKNIACLSEEDAKMVCRLLKIKYSN